MKKRSNRMQKFCRTLVVAGMALVAIGSKEAVAGTFADSFATGLDANYWSVIQSTPNFYSVNAAGGGIQLVKNATPNPGGVQYVLVRVNLAALGGAITNDFSVQVSFSGAVVPGPGLNQVELHTYYQNGSIFYTVYDRVVGYLNAHVWDGSSVLGATSVDANTGTFRITRVGATVTGYFNDMPLTSRERGSPLTAVDFVLQNNAGSDDAISVTFDNFSMSGPSVAEVFTNNTTIGVGDVTYDGQAIVANNCTLTVNGQHTFASLWLTDGAVLTHSPAPAGEADNRLDLAIVGDLKIDATSRVDANARGYGSAAGPGIGNSDYSTPSGGGHGGPGGNGWYVAGSLSYGDLLAPNQAGSGGGNSMVHNPANGGAGGGIIRLNVGGVLTVEGQLTANGESRLASGGAGGSIYVTAGTLAGTGSVTANGGAAGYSLSGGGGGGRIALYYGNSTFSGGLTALGGVSTGAGSGGAGTLYLKANNQSVGDLLLDNTGINNAMETPITAPAAYRLTLTNATAYATNSLTLSGLRVCANGLLTHPPQGPRLQVLVQGDARVEANGAIGADKRGYPAQTGPGKGGVGGTWGDPGSGAGHGGQGGAAWSSPGGLTYGSATEPVDFGSGGGDTHPAPNRGGGAIQLTVEGTLTIDGRVSANADVATASYDGGGSGGSVWLTASRLTGFGSITAQGQIAGYPGSGSGSGGRIAIYTGVNDFAGAVAASGGVSSGGGSPGADGSSHYGPALPSGLIAWWRGEGDASDTMGVHPGAAQGGLSYPLAQVGQGFGFDSNDDRVAVPHAADLNPGAGGFTAQFWMRGTRAQPDSFSALLDKSHGFTDSTGWTLHCWTSDGHVSFGIGQGGSGSGNFQEVLSKTDVLDGNFHQVTAVWTGTEAQLFVDGTLEAHLAMSPPANNTRPLCLGYAWGGGTPQRFFRGTLDEIMLFNRALTPAEVASLYFNQGGPVSLSIQSTADGVLLAWPAGAAGFGLVARTNLSTGSWEAVTNTPAVNGDQKEVRLPSDTASQRFFQLKQ